MRRPLYRELSYILFYKTLLFGALGCVQAPFTQPRLSENSQASSPPVILGKSSFASGAADDQGPDGAARLQAADDEPSGAPRLLEPPVVGPLALPPGGSPELVQGFGDGASGGAGGCDFWIVSSRNCNGKIAPRDTRCCLEFYHRSSQCLIPRGREAFMASLRSDWPVCFVIHGSYNYWRDVVNESLLINRWIHAAAPNLPVQFVYFTWPSNGYMPFILPVDLAILGRRSAAHGAYLAQLITQLPPGQPVSVVGHSHGARTAAAALHVLGGGALEAGQALPAGFHAPERLRAVLIAAAIDHDWLNPGKRYGQALVVPERVLLMKNASDATLGIYPLRIGAGERALGKLGLGPDDRFAIGPLGTKVVEFDVGRFTSWHHGFDNYQERPELATALIPYVYFQDDPFQGDAPVTMGPVPGPPLFSTPAGIEPARTIVRKAPQKAPPGTPQVRAQSASPEIWVEELPPPEPRRQPVELRFENEGAND
jgi:hypothetical protein